MTTDLPSGPRPAHPRRPARNDARPGQPNSRQPPRWLPRALALAVAAVFIGIFAWNALGALKGLGVNLLIAFFVALALEPMTVWLVRRGWKRGAAAATSLLGSLVLVSVMLALFGNLFVEQVAQLVDTIPALYVDLQTWLKDQFDVAMPASDELLNKAVEQYGGDVASGALLVGSSILGGVFSFFTIMLVTYYLLAAGPRFRAAICAWLTPNRQEEVLRLWQITQVKVSDFINSRIVLAALASFFTFVFLSILGTDYALPLALFTGVVSQFVPTIGTYIGGALPVLVALTSQGLPQALGVLAFILAYQQIENLYLSPKVSARALEMNPAVSFVVVLAFGAVFGPLGAFLSLPIAATIQAVANTYIERHQLVESHMLHDPGVWQDIPGGPSGGEPGSDSRKRSGEGTGGEPPTPADPGPGRRSETRLAKRRRANRRAAQEAARTVDELREEGID